MTEKYLFNKYYNLFKDLVFFTVPAIGFVNIFTPFLVIRFSGEQLMIE